MTAIRPIIHNKLAQSIEDNYFKFLIVSFAAAASFSKIDLLREFGKGRIPKYIRLGQGLPEIRSSCYPWVMGALATLNAAFSHHVYRRLFASPPQKLKQD